MREASETIVRQVLGFIGRHPAPELLNDEAEREFDELALALFRFQMEHNAPYRKFAQLRRRTALTVKSWRDIPPVPIQAFKNAALSCEPPEVAEAVFMTSGTTNPELKGRQYHPTMRVWDASMKGPFKQFVLPDREKMTMLVLSPGRDRNANSSLARYLSLAVETFGAEDSRFFAGERGVRAEELAQALRECEAREQPVLLLGATFAYVQALDYFVEQGLSFRLPSGSRVLDTGGFKGQSREVEMNWLYAQFEERLGVPRYYCVNMYGMTELCSQFYDKTIRSHWAAGEAAIAKMGPPWLRACVLDPDTLRPAEDGRVGVLAHYDLANWNSCVAILTEDLGVMTEDGFQLLGRIKSAEARGCSLAAEQFLQSNG